MGYTIRPTTPAATNTVGFNLTLVPPVIGDFAWRNQGGASIVSATAGVYLLAPSGAGDNYRILEKTVVGNHTVIAGWVPHRPDVNYAGGGIGWTDGTKHVAVNYCWGAVAGQSAIQLGQYTNVTTYSGSYGTFPFTLGYAGMVWVKLQDDGTNRLTSVSMDGSNWMQIHSVVRTSFLTATKLMFFANSNNATWNSAISLLHWAQS